MLTPRQRIKLALEHKESDRIPIGYWSTPEAKENLKKYLNITLDRDLFNRLGVDYRFIFPDYIGPKDLSMDIMLESSGKDIWGVERKIVRNAYGTYSEITKYPLKDVTDIEDLEEYPWPKVEWFGFDSIKRQIKALEEVDEFFIVLRGASVFDFAWFMRGMEQFFMDLLVNQDFANKIIEKIYNFWTSITSESIKAANGRIDGIFFGDDIGGQEKMLISLDTWRKMVKPWFEKLFARSHALRIKNFYHSCGSIGPIIEDLIEIGLDVLNPLQFSAKGFPLPEKLKNSYGDKLCFCGGMDVQTVLPFYSAADIKKETERLVRILGKDGGYIIQSSHNIQADTKPENIMAMYDAALKCAY